MQLPSAAQAQAVDAETGSAALHVLTDPVLWRTITRFMRGWPLIVKQMYDVRGLYEFSDCGKSHPRKRNEYTQSYHEGVLPHVAIMENNFKVLTMLYELYNVPYYSAWSKFRFTRVIPCAVYFGRLEILQWLYARLPSHPEWLRGTSLLHDAFANDDLDLIDWVYQHFPAANLGVVRPRAQEACVNVEFIKWLHEHGLRVYPEVMQTAVRRGHLDIVQYLHETQSEDARSPDTMDRAAKYKQFEVLEYLHHSKAQCTTKAMDYAAGAGRLDIVKLLHDERTEGCTTEAMDSAARHGHLDMLQFLHDHRSEGCTAMAFDYAARNGHLEIVKFLHENRSEGYTTRAVDSAAKRGHLQIVQFLLEHRSEGCTTQAAFWSVHNGHRQVLWYLLSGLQQQPELFLESLLSDAAIGGCEETLRVLCEFSAVGCLWEARERARKWKLWKNVAVLTEFISRDCVSCSLDLHGAAGVRRCQAEATAGQAGGCAGRDQGLGWRSALATGPEDSKTRARVTNAA
ncbi:Ankyrin repeat [Globisporangium polare]